VFSSATPGDLSEGGATLLRRTSDVFSHIQHQDPAIIDCSARRVARWRSPGGSRGHSLNVGVAKDLLGLYNYSRTHAKALQSTATQDIASYNMTARLCPDL
jgi:hypothetical protein